MKIIVDIVLCAIVALGFVLGFKRGFVKTIAKPVKFVATLVVSFGWANEVAELWIQPMIHTPVANKLSEFLSEQCAHLTPENTAEELPTLLKLAAGLFDIDIAEVTENASTTVIDALSQALTEPVVHIVAVVISFVLLLILSTIVFSVLLWIIDQIFKVGPFNVINKVFGCVFGTALGVIIAWVITISFQFVIGLSIFENNEVLKDFAGGPVFQFINQYNPIDLLFGF